MTSDTKRQGGEQTYLDLLQRPLGEFCDDDLRALHDYLAALYLDIKFKKEDIEALRQQVKTMMDLSEIYQSDMIAAQEEVEKLRQHVGELEKAHQKIIGLDFDNDPVARLDESQMIARQALHKEPGEGGRSKRALRLLRSRKVMP